MIPRSRPASLDIEEDSHFAKVSDFLYLGSDCAGMDDRKLAAHKITHIINATSKQPNYFEARENIKYMRLGLRDVPSESIQRHLRPAFAFIEEAKESGGACLVHCKAGVSRSVTIVLAYLISIEGLSLAEGLMKVRKTRPWVAPNHGFMAQLLSLEETSSVNLAMYMEDHFSCLEALRIEKEPRQRLCLSA